MPRRWSQYLAAVTGAMGSACAPKKRCVAKAVSASSSARSAGLISASDSAYGAPRARLETLRASDSLKPLRARAGHTRSSIGSCSHPGCSTSLAAAGGAAAPAPSSSLPMSAASAQEGAPASSAASSSSAAAAGMARPCRAAGGGAAAAASSRAMVSRRRSGTPREAACASDIPATSAAVLYQLSLSLVANPSSASPDCRPSAWQAAWMASATSASECRAAVWGSSSRAAAALASRRAADRKSVRRGGRRRSGARLRRPKLNMSIACSRCAGIAMWRPARVSTLLMQRLATKQTLVARGRSSPSLPVGVNCSHAMPSEGGVRPASPRSCVQNKNLQYL
jgi:hypothetical protein